MKPSPALRAPGLGALGFCLATLALALATSASATQYPRGPGNCCPDTLSIIHVQNPTASPHPVVPDTVRGVGGIVTGFDPKATGFGFYLQMTNGLPYSGVFVFTAAFNKGPGSPLNLGDSVVVYGKVQEFQNGTEIEGLDYNSGTDDVICRFVSSGHPLPPFHIGTITELREPAPDTLAEKWEGCLVRLRGPLRVARTSLTGGLGTNAFLLVDAGQPSPPDSVFVDGNTLTTYAPPAVGAIADSVQGLFDQRTPGYRIQLRDGNDIAISAPPNVTDAFPIFDNDTPGPSRLDSIMVVFDRAVEKSSAENTNNYALGSMGTVSGAHRLDAPDDNRVVLEIHNGLGDGDAESVTVSGVVGLANGLPMSGAQERDFFNGVLSPAMVQAPDPIYLAGDVCQDRSRFAGAGSAAGNRLSVSGTVTFALGSQYLFQDGTGLRSGLAVFAPIVPLTPGHRYLFVGAVQEYYEETEATSNVYVRDYGSAPVPAATVQTVGVLSDTVCDRTQFLRNGEDYEGMLVTVAKVMITHSQPGGSSFVVASTGGGPADSILIASLYGNFTFAADSGHIVTVTGGLRFSYGTFRICPRNDADIQDFGSGPMSGAALTVSNNATDSRDPDVILCGDGSLFMAWGRGAMQAAYSVSPDSGANWSLPKAVPRQGSQPALALADSNKICVLTAGLDSLRFHQSVDGGVQMLPVVGMVDGFQTHYPALAVGSNGHLHAAWERHQAGVYYARSLTGGATFSAATALGVDNWPQDHHSMARIVASRGDSVYVFWEYQRASGPPNNRILFSRSFDGGVSFSTPRAISDTTVVAALGDAQIDATGAIYVMRMQASPTDTVDFLRSTDGGGTFTRIGYLPALAPSGVCPKSFVLGPSGAVYAIVGICSADLYYTHSANGGANWDPLVNFTHGHGTVGEPRGAKIIIDPNGKPMVVWFATVVGSTEIFIGRMIN